MVELEWLGDKVTRAVFDCFNRIPDRAKSRDHNADDIWVQLNGLLNDLGSVYAGESEVGNDRVECEV